MSLTARMNFIGPLSVLLVSTMLYCCATPLGPKELTAGAYPKDYAQMIHNELEETLFDYDSAKIEINPPYEKENDNAFACDVKFKQVVWYSDVKINAKNRYGAYVGWTPFMALFSHGKLVCLKKIH